ncbi:MAG: Unknown protein [uncultured Sulfurovum sp.]|uniref:Uncharacterized protein n=1 Tax=uncultured Sulfurovum sp. TaxID=269237 RepID=A0A6S6TRG4_9BACT|nr:MAG: Unknown protein [uncultured Sulfurovum sp.]
MQKIILVSTILVSSLLADTSLGQKISVASAQETISNQTISQEPLRTRVNPNQQSHIQHSTASNHVNQLNTRVSPQNVKRTFKKDHHRYDKRYSNFDYDRHGYYNDDGYYYGYYDTTGYFFNNIFFAYNLNYGYHDRHYRRGFFRHGHRHHRYYVHHTFNNWNRIHSYRSPNVIVRGHYYDRAYYPRRHHNNHYRPNHYQSHYNSRPHYNNHRYNHNRNSARMHVTRRGNDNVRRSRPNTANYNTNRNSTRMNTRSNTRSHSNNYRNNSQNQIRRGQARMNTRGSSGKHSRHMGTSR